MSPPPPRDPRATPRLELPVPGDETPPDYVTVAGALADRLDEIVVPVIHPPELSQPPYNDPYDGMTIDLASTSRNWRMRWHDGAWWFVGGPPATSFASTDAANYVANTWVGGFAPTYVMPRQGTYQVTAVASLRQPSAMVANFYLDFDCSSAPNQILGPASRVTIGAGAGGSAMGTISAQGEFLLDAGEIVRLAVWNDIAVTMMERFMTVTPVWFY